MANPTSTTELRPGERIVKLPAREDAGLFFIGRASTPWKSRSECPRQGDAENGPVCRIDLDALWRDALSGVKSSGRLQVLYWMHEARRDLVIQTPRPVEGARGTFALRSPNRPNPIASSMVTVVGIEDAVLLVRGLDCVDGTPILDIKPDLCPHG
jgi:tRNA-Thr(GGU) m(6)t(6)A37 methyltransferase TsaA